MIRDATADDIPVLLDMGERFAAKGHIPCGYDRETMAQTFAHLIEHGILLITEARDGAIGALCHPHPFNRHHLTGQELFWWSEAKGTGSALFDALERRIEALGVNSFSMIALEALRPEAVGALYRRRGYSPVEHSYMKVF